MSADFPRIIGNGAAVIAGFALLYWVMRRMKKWLIAGDESVSEMFTMQDIREMRARGDIDEAEFLRMRAVILGSLGIAENGEQSDALETLDSEDDPDASRAH